MNRPSQAVIAECVARIAHAGQFRRDGKTPYITHPEAVAGIIASRADAHDSVIAAAWLHDVFEDTSITISQARAAGVDLDVLLMASRLTRNKGEEYEQYLMRVKGDPLARDVKVADMLHNLSDSPTEKQVVKYARGLLVLLT